jgi:hypothetical protein
LKKEDKKIGAGILSGGREKEIGNRSAAIRV